MNRYIITGGPGSGKSTLINALKERRFPCVEEVSREMIKEEVSKKSQCLPWINLPCFAQKVLNKMITDYQSCSAPVSFFDRGIPDVIAYLINHGFAVDEKLFQIAEKYRYHKNVLIAPPWQEIYVNDDERWQTYEESKQLYQSLKRVYKELKYDLIEIPKVTVIDRMEFVLKLTK